VSGDRRDEDVRELLKFWRAPGWHAAPHLRWAIDGLRAAGLIEAARKGEGYGPGQMVWIRPTPEGLAWPDWRQYAADWYARGATMKGSSPLAVCSTVGVHHVTQHSPVDWRARIGTFQILADAVPGLKWVQHSVTQFKVTRHADCTRIGTHHVVAAWARGERIDWEDARAREQERARVAWETRRRAVDPEAREAKRRAYREREKERRALAHAAAKAAGFAPEPAPVIVLHPVAEGPSPPIVGVDDHAARLLPRLRPYAGTWAIWVETIGTMSRHPRARLLQSLGQLTRSGYIDARYIDAIDGESRAMLRLRILDRGRRYAAAS